MRRNKGKCVTMWEIKVMCTMLPKRGVRCYKRDGEMDDDTEVRYVMRWVNEGDKNDPNNAMVWGNEGAIYDANKETGEMYEATML